MSKDIPYNKKMDPKAKALMLIFILLLVGAVAGIIISKTSLGFLEYRIAQGARNVSTQPYWPGFVNNYTMMTIIISMNLCLLIGLLVSYIKSFKITKSSFLLGLVLFLMVLFVQSLLSLPFLNILMNVSYLAPRLEITYLLASYQNVVVPMLANMFETIAIIILYYLSQE